MVIKVRYKCVNRKKCVKESCIIEVVDGDSKPENCPYMTWSNVKYPKWKKIYEKEVISNSGKRGKDKKPRTRQKKIKEQFDEYYVA